MGNRAIGAGEATLFPVELPMPDGFEYRGRVISILAEQELLAHFARLRFEPFEFHGYHGKRHAVSYGWEYDFNEEGLRKIGEMPAFLAPARDVAAEFAGLQPAELSHALLLKYPPGAGIGWHRDKPQFGDVIGLSILSSCVLRFRRRMGGRWERTSIVAEPRSVYLLRGASRWEWEHSIPAVEAERYSITFRTVRGMRDPEIEGGGSKRARS